MSQTVRVPAKPRPQDSSASSVAVNAAARTAAMGEAAARGAVGAVQATCMVVRNYPVLSVFLAAGLGYFVGKARGYMAR
jgi:hypothetical protein